MTVIKILGYVIGAIIALLMERLLDRYRYDKLLLRYITTYRKAKDSGEDTYNTMRNMVLFRKGFKGIDAQTEFYEVWESRIDELYEAENSQE